MTEITDQDRRQLREDAKAVINKTAMMSSAAVSIAQYILATVDVPEPTLAEELRCLTRRLERTTDPDRLLDLAADFFSVADYAEQMEHDLAEARAEATALAEDLAGAESEVERLTEALKQLSERVTARLAMPPGDIPGTALPINVMTVAPDPTTPNPADVKPGEAWLVECRGERRNAMKDNSLSIEWNTVNADGWPVVEDSEDITLITRLVPAPRVITNPDELDALAEGSIVRDNEGDPATRRAGGLDYRGVEGVCNDVHHYLPVTVLWEPGA